MDEIIKDEVIEEVIEQTEAPAVAEETSEIVETEAPAVAEEVPAPEVATEAAA